VVSLTVRCGAQADVQVNQVNKMGSHSMTRCDDCNPVCTWGGMKAGTLVDHLAMVVGRSQCLGSTASLRAFSWCKTSSR
jgi:hypothetical protein